MANLERLNLSPGMTMSKAVYENVFQTLPQTVSDLHHQMVYHPADSGPVPPLQHTQHTAQIHNISS